MPSVHISFAAPWWGVALCVAAGFSLALLFYRFTLPPVSPARRVVFVALRGLAFTILLLLLCEPVVRVLHTEHLPSHLAVLIDESASMSIDDASGRRSAVARRLLHDVVPDALPPGASARYYGFDAGLHASSDNPPDTLSARAEVTDIAQSLADLLQRKETEPAQAAVMITDGSVTLGDNPVHAAGSLGMPIVTIGVGDTAEHRDVILSRISTNDLVYAGTSVTAGVFISQRGYDSADAKVSISEAGRLIASTRVRLLSGGGETPASLTYVPETEGMHRYRVAITPFDGEFTAANNERTISVRVMKNRLRILIVAAAPGPDLVVIRQTLAEQKGFSVAVRTQRQGGGYYEGGLTNDLLDSTDCVVTIGLPAPSTPPTAVQLIADAVLNRHIPLLFVGGPRFDPSRLGPLAEVLPVTLRKSGHSSGEVECIPDDRQRIHPLITAGGEIDPALWRELPPVNWGEYATSLREGSVQLITPAMRNVPLPMPLIAARTLAGTRSVAIAACDIWRWRLMGQATPRTSDFFSAFMRAAVTWLSSPNDIRPVKVATTKDSYPRGERIAFEAQVVDGAAQPVSGAELRVVVFSRDHPLAVDLRTQGSGRYEGSQDGLEEGVYRWKATAMLAGSLLGADSGSFNVGGMNLEFLETRMNADLLRQIAYRSGGVYLPAQDAAGSLRMVLDTLRTLKSTRREDTSTFELPHWPWMLGALLALFGMEWVLRKRSGML